MMSTSINAAGGQAGDQGPQGGNPSAQAPEELDVRRLPHGRGRHDAIFGRLNALNPGGQLVIVNDHDPRPLRYQIDVVWPEVFDWEYLEAGPQVWRVAITRRA
jgi:uncharacterized protein (DUF2249 family)